MALEGVVSCGQLKNGTASSVWCTPAIAGRGSCITAAHPTSITQHTRLRVHTQASPLLVMSIDLRPCPVVAVAALNDALQALDMKLTYQPPVSDGRWVLKDDSGTQIQFKVRVCVYIHQLQAFCGLFVCGRRLAVSRAV